ncbi:hypothetical protein LOTGIDRAFT_171039 [Lottia gigantea]|uniref:Uncharacterized protein n=1 Tax=Lottia gigantea TaxID=225164 RepID=V4CP53_LOTGI|nr:hypothetical protein LOTGIDRAFT_171039 [Lottia gigantea]ESP04200.1 hypothetical protein LOTGIDRAFT_171039 [Lottia gigantea]
MTAGMSSLKNSPLKPTYNKALKRLSRQLSWDGSSGHQFMLDCPATEDSITTFEEEASLTTSTSTGTASSTDSLTSAYSFKHNYFPSAANNPSVSRQSSINSVSSGYIAELEDSVNDPLSRSPSLFESDQDDSKDILTLENVFDRVLTWDNDPGSQSGSPQDSFNTNEVDNKMKSVFSDSDISSVSIQHKDLILPDEDSTGISFSKYSLNKSTKSDSSVRFSTESSAYSDTSDSIYNKQHSVSLPNIASASAAGMSPIYPGFSPPLSTFTSQERVNYGNFAMMNPMIQHVPSAAESVLLSLGFGDSGRCLPQRFMSSWYEKLAKAQAEQQEFLKCQQLKKTCFSNVNLHNSKTSEVSKDTPQSKVSLKSNEKPILRYPTVSKLNLKTKLPCAESKCKSSVKDTRLARLREYVESHAGLLKLGLGGVNHKRKIFSDSRQQSLPINLETLNEEEEINLQREKLEVNQKSLLKDFLKEEGLSDSCTSFSDSDFSYDSKKQDQKIELDKVYVHEVHHVPKEENDNKQTVVASEMSKTGKKSNISSDSLEVANIMKPTQIEPAMVSIILQDVDGNIQMTSPVTVDQPDPSLLHIPMSPSISSPIPQSPVTVIEVGLDNQLDSLDIDDATPRLNELNDQQEEEPELDDLVDHLSDEALDAECASLQLSTSPEDSPSPLPSPLNISPHLFEDAGSSPTAYEDSSSGIQADDGSLTPLEKIQDCELHLEVIQDLGDEFYLVKEGRVQCVNVGCQYEPQPSDRIKYPLFRNKLLAVGSSDSDSLISDGQNSSPLLTVSQRCSVSPPIHLHTTRNSFFIKGVKHALSDSEIHKSFSEKKQTILGYPALILTNENGEDNDLDPDSDTTFNNHFKPIDSSVDSSIGSDDDQYLITKPRPRRCSRHKRSLMYSDTKESDFSNSDDSVFIQPKNRKLYKCNSVEQECQTDQKYFPDSSSSSSPSPRSRYDQDIQMDRCSISSLVDQCTQTIQEVSETSRTTECKEIQTDTNVKSTQCVQTHGLVRTAEAFCQTPLPPPLQSKESQTDDESNFFVQKGLNEDIQTRFTSTANFTLRTQFDASSPVPNGNGACLLHQNSFTTVSSSECSSFSEISSENGSTDSSQQHYEDPESPLFPRKSWTQQIETEMPQNDEYYDIFKTIVEETYNSPKEQSECLNSRYLDNQSDIQCVNASTSSNTESSSSFRNSMIGDVADTQCSFRHTYTGSSDSEAPCMNQCWSTNCSMKSFSNHIDSMIPDLPYRNQNGSSDFSVNSFINHIDSPISELPYMNQNGCCGIKLENEHNRISETLDERDSGSAEIQLRTSTAGSQEALEPSSLNTGNSESFNRSCQQYESDIGVIEIIGSDGHMDDKVQMTSKIFVDPIHNRSSKSSFRSSRKHADSGFYETPCNSSDDLMSKRVPNVSHGTRLTETRGCNSENRFDKKVTGTVDISEVQLSISDSQIVNRVSKASQVSEDQAISMSKSLIYETSKQTTKNLYETPSFVSKHQSKTTTGNTKENDFENKSLPNQYRVSDTPYKLSRGPIQYKDSDIPYRGHMYHIENQVSQSRHSKDNINIWVSEAPYIIRPEPNSLLEQLKRSCPSRRRSYRRKSVKALASLFDNKQ